MILCTFDFVWYFVFGFFFFFLMFFCVFFFFFSSRRRHTRFDCDWSSDVCSSDLPVHPSSSRQHRPPSPGQLSSPSSYDDGRAMIHLDSKLPRVGTTIFTVMSQQIGRASCRERV